MSSKQQLQNLAKKYPNSNTSKLITFGTMAVTLVSTLLSAIHPDFTLPTEAIYSLFLAFLTSGGIGLLNAHSKRVGRARVAEAEAQTHVVTVPEHPATGADEPQADTAPSSDMFPEEKDDAKLDRHLVRKGGKLSDEATGQYKTYIEPPTDFVPPGVPLQTNLKHKANIGAVLPKNQAFLWVKVNGARSYVTAKLNKEGIRDGGALIRVKQSHVHDEDNDVQTTRIWMTDSKGRRLPPGKYTVTFQGDAGTSAAMRTGIGFTVL